MSTRRAGVWMISLVPAVLAVTVLAACNANRDDVSRRIQRAIADEARGEAHDPCTLLSASEAEPYVGAPATSPFRASDGVPDVRGDQCVYRGTDGREVAVRPSWHGGQAIGRIMRDVPNALGSALSKAGATGMDTMAHRVMAPGPAGPWDQATWIPSGALFASRGEDQVQVDVSGASGQENDALALARLIMPRFDHPLSYDGAKAVALAPKPRPHPPNACDFLPRPAVETAIGALDAAPTSDSPEASCTYRVASAQGEREYPVAFTWEGGQKSYRMFEHGMAMFGGVTGLPTSSPLDTMKPPPQMQAAIGGLMKMIGGASGPKGTAAAPGAATTVGFRTDTTLRSSCDHAALLHGTQLIGVRGDVFVGVTLQSADYDKARALLNAICSRL